jgi:hypothetical protein
MRTTPYCHRDCMTSMLPSLSIGKSVEVFRSHFTMCNTQLLFHYPITATTGRLAYAAIVNPAPKSCLTILTQILVPNEMSIIPTKISKYISCLTRCSKYKASKITPRIRYWQSRPRYIEEVSSDTSPVQFRTFLNPTKRYATEPAELFPPFSEARL